MPEPCCVLLLVAIGVVNVEPVSRCECVSSCVFRDDVVPPIQAMFGDVSV